MSLEGVSLALVIWALVEDQMTSGSLQQDWSPDIGYSSNQGSAISLRQGEMDSDSAAHGVARLWPQLLAERAAPPGVEIAGLLLQQLGTAPPGISPLPRGRRKFLPGSLHRI